MQLMFWTLAKVGLTLLKVRLFLFFLNVFCLILIFSFFADYIAPMFMSTSIRELLETSEVVGNILYRDPTLFVSPGQVNSTETSRL